jgi:hypothetical protein
MTDGDFLEPVTIQHIVYNVVFPYFRRWTMGSNLVTTSYHVPSRLLVMETQAKTLQLQATDSESEICSDAHEVIYDVSSNS